MIVIILLLLFSFYLFWRFDQQRKLRNAEHQREKREAFMNLIGKLKKQQDDLNNTTSK